MYQTKKIGSAMGCIPVTHSRHNGPMVEDWYKGSRKMIWLFLRTVIHPTVWPTDPEVSSATLRSVVLGRNGWLIVTSPGLRAFMDVEWWLSTRTQNKSLKWWPKNPNVWWFVSSPLLVDLLIDPLRTGDVWHEHDSCTSSWSSVRINMWNIVSMSLWGPSPGDQTTRLGSLRPPNHAEEKMQQPSSPAFRELELLGSRSDFVRVAMTVSCVLVQVQLCPGQVV